MANAKPQHKAKPSKKNRKWGRNKAKCDRYRARVGNPAGPGVKGNKAGKNHKRLT